MTDQTPDSPRTSMPPDHVGLLIIGVIMMIGGWWGLYLLITSTPPFIGPPMWGFFVLLHIATTGTVLPFVRYLNVRFTPINADLTPSGVIARQSIWIGVFVATCAWLQLLKSPNGDRVLSLPVAFFLGLILVVIEFVLRSREVNAEEE
jgi:hypothetical protein